jgi:hypothetical protein
MSPVSLARLGRARTGSSKLSLSDSGTWYRELIALCCFFFSSYTSSSPFFFWSACTGRSSSGLWGTLRFCSCIFAATVCAMKEGVPVALIRSVAFGSACFLPGWLGVSCDDPSPLRFFGKVFPSKYARPTPGRLRSGALGAGAGAAWSSPSLRAGAGAHARCETGRRQRIRVCRGRKVRPHLSEELYPTASAMWFRLSLSLICDLCV